MSTTKRFIELKNKLTSSGLTPQESRELEQLRAVVTNEDLKLMREVQQTMSKSASY